MLMFCRAVGASTAYRLEYSFDKGNAIWDQMQIVSANAQNLSILPMTNKPGICISNRRLPEC
jgi:hypothetical protein